MFRTLESRPLKISQLAAYFSGTSEGPPELSREETSPQTLLGQVPKAGVPPNLPLRRGRHALLTPSVLEGLPTLWAGVRLSVCCSLSLATSLTTYMNWRRVVSN